MICTHTNGMAHYDVMIGHGTKGSVDYKISTKSSAQNGISIGDLGMEIPSKQAIAWQGY